MKLVFTKYFSLNRSTSVFCLSRLQILTIEVNDKRLFLYFCLQVSNNACHWSLIFKLQCLYISRLLLEMNCIISLYYSYFIVWTINININTYCFIFRLPTPRPGEVLGLVGTNGIGKSTALKILAGKLKPNLGRFSVWALKYYIFMYNDATKWCNKIWINHCFKKV